jgi:hypothetical protein
MDQRTGGLGDGSLVAVEVAGSALGTLQQRQAEIKQVGLRRSRQSKPSHTKEHRTSISTTTELSTTASRNHLGGGGHVELNLVLAAVGAGAAGVADLLAREENKTTHMSVRNGKPGKQASGAP